MRLTPCAKGCSRMLLICNQVAHESQCEGTLPMTNIAGLQVSKVFGDETYKEETLARVRLALGQGNRVLLSAELRENNLSVPDCQLLLRTLYMEVKDVCQDLGFVPDVMVEGGGPRGGGVAMLELIPLEKFLSDKR